MVRGCRGLQGISPAMTTFHIQAGLSQQQILEPLLLVSVQHPTRGTIQIILMRLVNQVLMEQVERNVFVLVHLEL